MPDDANFEEVIEDNSPSKEYYLDPEGGYKDPEAGRMAELAAMTK